MVTQPGDSTSLDTRVLLNILTELKRGNFSVRMPVDWTGVPGKIADALNAVLDLNERSANELVRVGRMVGKEGKITERVSLGDGTGRWAGRVESVNNLVEDLVRPTSEMARVIGAVANGDLSQTMELEMDGRPLQGQFLRSARTVNTMVKQLSSFASEVTRVAREVGTEGKLGGQAQVKGVAGVWKDLTDNVNWMAGNLTAQVRNIAEVTTAVARGDLSKKITVDVKGEIFQLKNTINVMVDQLNAFASEVTRVAREVGTEGKLGGQAQVRGVGGVWKDLTDNVNQLAAKVTTQVRNIAEVTTAVARGDLSRKITVDVRGEILQLKDTINVMVDQLNASLSQRLKYGVDMVADLSSTLEPREVLSRLLYRAATSIRADQGLLLRIDGDELVLELSYATEGQGYLKEPLLTGAKLLIGQAIAERQPILGGPIELLAEATQSSWHLAILPLTVGDDVTAVLLLARRDGPGFSAGDLELLGLIGNVAVVALRNAQLFGTAEEASRAKSNFLSMAAHELRTPLSVISGYVAMLDDGSLGVPPEQWKEPLQVLVRKGSELNRIVDDLLFASRMETGPVLLRKTVLDLRDVAQEALARADARARLLEAEMSRTLPEGPVPVLADREHLGRILDNLINNALTYSTGQPWVRVTVSGLQAPRIVVEDRGVGIPLALRERIFERFFRVDTPGLGQSSGTGLGLHISRQLAELHGGRLTLEHTEVGQGSVFALDLPSSGSPPALAANSSQARSLAEVSGR